jgi:hypothetical protein
MLMGMGGTSLASRNPLFVNPYNPASYTCFDSTSFVFDGALQARISTLNTSSASEKLNDAGLAYITMGFPVTRFWKASLGVMPYSSVNYKMGNDSVLENIGKVQYSYSGSGGLNRAFIGSAFQPFPKISLGVNASYIFGTLNKERTLSFPDSASHLSSKITNATIIRNLYFDFGFQYHTSLPNGHFLNAGLIFSPGQNLSSSSDFLAVTFAHNSTSNLDIIRDTSYINSDVNGDIFIPMVIGSGISYGSKNRWSVGADLQFQQWSKYLFFGTSDSLKNSLRLSIGGQFKPSQVDVGSYWKRINYRAGFRFEKSFIELRDKNLNEFGISFGIGLPMKKSRSTLNLAFEAGTFGTTDNRLVKENYFRFSMGASLFEKWFLKRKYD